MNSNRYTAYAISLAMILLSSPVLADIAPPTSELSREELSRYMNSIPPSKGYFCVSNGLTNMALHPDRAPFTDLAQHGGVILFSGAAPQRGLNFSLSAGSLIYSNQMSTLGSSEPAPQVGTAGTLLQRGDGFILPWSQARWHTGEQITWQGFRASAVWMDGLPNFEFTDLSTQPMPVTQIEGLTDLSGVHEPKIALLSVRGEEPDWQWGVKTSALLQLSPGLYQTNWLERFWTTGSDVPPNSFREPWFQGRGEEPAFNATADLDQLTDYRQAVDYYPNYFNIYPYTQLELDGGRMVVDFERSATWPREPIEYTLPTSDTRNAGSEPLASMHGGAHAGIVVAESVSDEYGNRVVFDRVPEYQWGTDLKAPPRSRAFVTSGTGADTSIAALPYNTYYRPVPQAYRLPSKRLRTVQLYDSDDAVTPVWTVAFVYEHPESDRIDGADISDQDQWKSIYSHLPQSKREHAPLPPLNDETTLLTVQAYKGARSTINGRALKDDYSVWTSEDGSGAARLGVGPEELGDSNSDGCPGLCDVDDDGDGLIDEDCNDREPYDANYGQGCSATWTHDDNEDGIVEYEDPVGTWHGVTAYYQQATDPPGDENNDGKPGIAGIDDDGDGLIDEDSNGNLPYLDVDSQNCRPCQLALTTYTNIDDYAACGMSADDYSVPQSSEATGTPCYNPLYWSDWYIDPGTPSTPRDRSSHLDDDEDGLVDEDSDKNPLFVDIAGIAAPANGTGCETGKHPFVPADSGLHDGDHECVFPGTDTNDPWVYQVQYVYARTNPYWLMSRRDEDGVTEYLDGPTYYYYTPFKKDYNGNGTRDAIIDRNNNGSLDAEDIWEPTWDPADPSTQWIGDPANPNVHPDCLPHPDYRGPQGKASDASSGSVPPTAPSEIHLIKRVVRMRDDANNPTPGETVEQVWLYRYNDIGFLKAVFAPADVQAIISAKSDDPLAEPDDILKYADTYPIDGKPLIMYASQWYTYYNPYNFDQSLYDNHDEQPGLPQCYDAPPFVGDCDDDERDVTKYLPMNGCDGEYMWESGYTDEIQTDQDCSPFMRQDCGFCFARYGCSEDSNCTSSPDYCFCEEGSSLDANQLAQMGIPGAQPRYRKHLVKTARVRGGDGETHLYRFDYLGAASSVYTDGARLTSYADPHNITIVDELEEQTSSELENPGDFGKRNEFYIYEDDFKISLDAAETPAATFYDYNSLVDISTHYLHIPVKVKTRRVVTMNYYGIATSDRLIVTPGYMGDSTSLVDDQQYELTNMRGQMKQLFDPSWVATLRHGGQEAVKTAGRVATQLFGGPEGWHSVVKGLAWGSDGGNVYNQQCRTPEVIDDVPIQRVDTDQLRLVSVTEHEQTGDSYSTIDDKPLAEAAFYKPTFLTDLGSSGYDIDIDDPAGTIGSSTGCTKVDVGDVCTDGTCDCWTPPEDVVYYPEDGRCVDWLSGIDLHSQDPVTVSGVYDVSDAEGDGISVIRYHYDYWDGNDQKVKLKYRWIEPVSQVNGGTGSVALDIWFFDQLGRLRVHGTGSGTWSGGTTHPTVPTTPTTGEQDEAFYLTYFGYDDTGRLAVHVSDFDPAWLCTYATSLGWSGSALPGELHRCGTSTNDVAKGLCTRSVYNDFGMLISKRVGFALNASGAQDGTFAPDPGNADHDATRTDYKILANRSIWWTDEFAGANPCRAWEDPHIYSLVYNHVYPGSGSDPAEVYGTTTVNIMDAGGKPIEQRVLAWADPDMRTDDRNPRDKIEDFGWAVSLTDYDYDGRIAQWGANEIPNELLMENCPPGTTGTPPLCIDGSDSGYAVNTGLDITPEYPGAHWDYDDDTWSFDEGSEPWPPDAGSQVKTLSRSLKRYEQASSMKPTHDLVFRSFDEAYTGQDWEDDPRIVVTKYTYDLEDRIARQQAPDGTIERLLYDSKRRPTKVFKGSTDGATDWFPAAPPEFTQDDMVLLTHNLYNDGIPGREYNPLPGNLSDNPGENTNFPNNANMLVRVRNFTGDAEPAESAYDWDSPSRDTQYLYDWRGRAVITKIGAVGYNDADLSTPCFISATTTVYDNLDRPVITATWAEDDVPTSVEVIDDPDSNTGWAYALSTNALTSILTYNDGPQSLSKTFYDERGRVFEQRTYDVTDTSGSTYSFSKTYRDDLGRVLSTVTPTGTTVNKYDSLGRTLETSFWSKEDSSNPGRPDTTNGLELTRTVRTYDAFGAVLTTRNITRKAGVNTTALLGSTNAIQSYSSTWYDKARRPIANASYGSNHADGYTWNGSEPEYDEDSPPTWDGSSGTYVLCATCSDEALVTLHGYDEAGRKVWTRDPKGILSKTWYDLLGRTILQAENYADDSRYFEGPSRYTAHHYTRSGLLDMIVAILPTDTVATLDPDDITWNGESASNDFSATGVSVTGATVQATSFVYGAEVLPEIGESPTAISTFPSLISEIRYPSTDQTGETPGQPSPTDRLAFKYTVSGQVAQRLDQRGVNISFEYGQDATSPPASLITAIDVDIPTGKSVDDFVDNLAFTYNDRNQLLTATAKQGTSTVRSMVTFAYDDEGKLTSETLDPTGDSSLSKTTSYEWDWYDASGQLDGRNRLISMTYPSGKNFVFQYGATASLDDSLNRVIGLNYVDNSTSPAIDDPIVSYQHTGAGRSMVKTWGDDVVGLDYRSGVLDRYGRVTDMEFVQDPNDRQTTIQRFQYGYDANGNRLFSRVTQQSQSNTRSFLYQYDNLGRLVNAEHGQLNAANKEFITSPKGEYWNLDLLGNWSGGSGAAGSHIMYSGSGAPGYNPAVDTLLSSDHFNVNEANEIVSQVVNDGQTPVTLTYAHDDSGSVTDDGTYTYTYDAWNRLVKVDDAVNTIATYTYDALGRRIKKTVTADANDAEYFYYDGSRVIEHDKLSSVSLSSADEYVYGLEYIDEPVAKYNSPNDVHYILQDINHNVIAVTDSTGSVEQQYAFHPYGLYLAHEDGQGQATALSSLMVPMGHQGLWFNPEIETYYNRARAFYDVDGIWLDRDLDAASPTAADTVGDTATQETSASTVVAPPVEEDPVTVDHSSNENEADANEEHADKEAAEEEDEKAAEVNEASTVVASDNTASSDD